jgi:hypothetical protein
MPPKTPHALTESPEYAVVAAILHQAVVDLQDTAPAQEREASRAFFSNQGRHLEWLCDLAALDYTCIQQAVRRQYPQGISAPRDPGNSSPTRPRGPVPPRRG